MKSLLKSIIIHLLVGLILFSSALVFFNYRITKNKDQNYSEMANSTYPVMDIASANGEYNMMSAYVDSVDLSLVRNQIAVVGNDRTVELRLHNYDYDITAIQYTLFSKSEEEAIEEGTLNKLEDEETGTSRIGRITFETNLEKGKTYYLKMAVRLNNSTRVNYYTKIQNGEGCHVDECMAYALKFHQNLFDKTEFEKNITYLEPNGKATKSLQHVDIHSSVDAVSFANMTLKEECDPIITIKEINDVYVVLQMDTILTSEIKDGVIQYYNISENYKLRYTSDRMYLLDYDRTMSAYYNKALYNPAKNYITLGIADSDDVDYVSSDKGYKVCFTQSGQLWYYDYQSSDVTKIFSFASENLGDQRNCQSNHGIQILQMDDEGNITYIIYGYINRGHYEGKNGIQLLRYNVKEKCNEELAFFATSIPYSSMKNDVSKLAYLNSQNIFYCILDGDLHAVDLNTREDKIMESGLINENITASKDQSIIAIESEKNLSKNKSIRMLDLESGKEQTFTCDDNKRIRAVGFLANDFIYGTADAADVKTSDGGALTFPMKNLAIVNIDGEKVKSYSKQKRYIVETEISGSVLEMKFGRKSKGKIVETSDRDYIRYKEDEESKDISLIYDYSSTYYDQLFIRFPNYVYIQVEPDLVLSKVLYNDNDMLINLERTRESITQYYVYAEGMEQDIYDNLMEAIVKADELRGNVISSKEQTMWECGFADYAMVAGMDQVTKAKSADKSLAACLEMIAKVNGKQVNAKDIKTKGSKVRELLEKYSGQEAYNLSGCSVDEVLYFISKGSPVLAKYKGKRYVILMSYNSSKIRYLDPVTGQSTAVDRKTLTSQLAKAGNKFYTYLTEE